MKRLASAGLLLSCVLCAPASAAPMNLVVNGDFESQPIAKGHFQVLHTIPGWTSDGANPSIEIQNRYHYDGGAGSAGPQLAELCASGNDRFSQLLPTLPGATYSFSLDHSYRPTLQHNGVNVLWDGRLLADLDADGRHHDAPDWTTHTFTVTATATTTEIEFAADPLLYHNRYPGGGWIDNVRLTLVSLPTTDKPTLPTEPTALTDPTPVPRVAPIPEPSPAAIALAAACTLALLRRRRPGNPLRPDRRVAFDLA